jgi:hypothetical protein
VVADALPYLCSLTYTQAGNHPGQLHHRMACTLLNRTPILSLLIILILLSLHSHSAFSNNIEDDDEDDYQYVVDSPLMGNLRLIKKPVFGHRDKDRYRL